MARFRHIWYTGGSEADAVKYLRGFAGAAVYVFGVTALASPPQAGLQLDVAVIDQTKLAVAGVRVELQARPAASLIAITDDEGHASFPGLGPGDYRIFVAHKGFETVRHDIRPAHGVAPKVELTLVPESEKSKIEVTAELTPVEAGATQATSIAGRLAKELPNRPATVADALPLVPGVVR